MNKKKGAFVRKRVKTSFNPKVFLAKVGEGKTISKYRKDQVVFSQGQVADSVFYIQQGKVKLTVVSEQGKEAVVAILGPGHFFGEGCLNGHPLRIATTRAVEECVLTRLEKATMIATIHNEPEFSELFMSYLLARNSRIEDFCTKLATTFIHGVVMPTGRDTRVRSESILVDCKTSAATLIRLSASLYPSGPRPRTILHGSKHSGLAHAR